jgi:hypothetical protein
VIIEKIKTDAQKALVLPVAIAIWLPIGRLGTLQHSAIVAQPRISTTKAHRLPAICNLELGKKLASRGLTAFNKSSE